MQLIINGERRECKSQTIQALLEEIGIEEKVMAAAVNMNVVKKEQWATFIISDNDKIEFLQFVGGG